MSKLKMKINNFGPINKADIEVNKLNITAGVNGSGKTTLAKLLYCFFGSKSNNIYLGHILLNSEFGEEYFKSEDFNVEFEKNEYSCPVGYNDSRLDFINNTTDLHPDNLNETIYIDSVSLYNGELKTPDFILKNQVFHMRVLMNLMDYTKYNSESDEISALMEGQINYDYNKEEYLFNDIPIKNTSAGVKQLGIIQKLFSNRELIENSVVIMDEPEVHLHPEWQVKLAEILVLAVKNLNVTLFISSHSPHFIEAVEVYSVKYAMRKDTNFYLTRKDDTSTKFNVEKIEYDKLYKLYKNLGDPYDIIDRVRGENLANDL